MRRARVSSAYIFMPEGVESGKIVGSTIYGAQVITIRGNYDDVNRLCSEIADKYGWAFVNINLRPYYTEGAKTFGFEVAEQLGWKLPDHIVVPTAGGTILPKVAKAFKELKEVGLVHGGEFKIHCAQAAGSAPVIHALHKGTDLITPVKPNTIAKSIAIGNPADGFYVLQRGARVRRMGRRGDRPRDHRRDQAARPHRGHLRRAGRRHHAGRHDEADRRRSASSPTRAWWSRSPATATRRWKRSAKSIEQPFVIEARLQGIRRALRAARRTANARSRAPPDLAARCSQRHKHRS